MKSLIKSLFLICVLSQCKIGFSQTGQVSGTIVDELGELYGATVMLLQVKDSTNVNATYSLVDGDFIFEEAPLDEEMFIKVSYIGYLDHFTSNFSLNSISDTLVLETIELEIENEVLGVVMLQTQNRPISYTNGKINVDVENSPLAKGSDAFSILNQLPGVSHGNGEDIQINGKSGVQVMVNGRLMNLKEDALKSYLESLPSDAIKSISLDTKPSAKHDAEGGAGILNIQLKDNKSGGLTGNVSAGYTYKQQHLWNTNLFLSQQNEKWSWLFLADVSKKSFNRDENMYKTFNPDASIDWLKQGGKENQTVKPINTQLELQYQINEKQRIGTNLQLRKSKSHQDWFRQSILKEKGSDLLQNIDSDNHHKANFDYGILQVFYALSTDTLGSELKLSADASSIKSKVNSDFYNIYEYEGDTDQTTEHLQTPSSSKYNILSAKADYKKVWKDHTSLSFGTKLSQIDYDSDLDFYTVQNEVPEHNIEKSSAFSYQERIWAGYVDFEKSLHPKWDLQAGLRVEKTWGEDEEKLLQQNNKRKYMDFFPNVQISHQISDNYKMEYAYSRRIDRPIFVLMNPQIFYMDPYSYIEGNPKLHPQRSNNFSINQLIHNRYSVELTYERTQDFMLEVPMVNNETNQTVFSTQNVKHLTSFGINIIAPLKLASFWRTENALTLNQQNYSLDNNEESIKNKKLFTLFQSQHNINLPYGIKLNASFSVQSPLAYGYYTINGQWWTDIGLQKSFYDDRLSINLRFTDIFKTMNTDAEYAFNGNTNVINQYMGNQSVGIQVQYNFGGNGKTKQESSKPEEYERIQQN